MTLSCPFCSKKITPDQIQCLSCGTVYRLDTLLRIRNLAKNLEPDNTHEGRKRDRLRRRFEVTFTCSKGFRKRHLSDISPGGMFINTSNPLNPGESVSLKISLPDEEQKLEIMGQVAWCRKEKKVTSKGELPPGMGIQFLNVSARTEERLHRILRVWK